MRLDHFLSFLLTFLIHTPFYPYWLDIINKEKEDDKILQRLKGIVLETGSGNCLKKYHALAINKKITKYIATDYKGWDYKFKNQTKLANRFGIFSKILYGKTKDLNEIDEVCDAMHLPFKNESFDSYCSFDVLEHISDPKAFYKEANRVLKKNGICLTTAPFLYREHGGMKADFQRFTRGGFIKLAQVSGFKIVNITTSSYFGTTLASLTNQYVIQKILEGKLILKTFLLLVAPLIFFLCNCIGYFIDSVDRDDRFALRYHVVMKK